VGHRTAKIRVRLHETVDDVFDEFLVSLPSMFSNQATITVGKIGEGHETFNLRVGDTARASGPIEVRLLTVDDEAHTATVLVADMRETPGA